MVVVDFSDQPAFEAETKELKEKGTPPEKIIVMMPILSNLDLEENLARRVHDSKEICGGLIIIHPGEEPYQLAGVGDELAIPVLMIKSSDAVRLREHGSALIQDAGAPRAEDRVLIVMIGYCVDA